MYIYIYVYIVSRSVFSSNLRSLFEKSNTVFNTCLDYIVHIIC